jgi:hypothetical protein
MKKLWLLGALALALSSTGLIAQEGLDIKAEVLTGAGVRIGSEHSALPTYPTFYIGNEDLDTRIRISAAKNWETYGFYIQTQFVRNNVSNSMPENAFAGIDWDKVIDGDPDYDPFSSIAVGNALSLRAMYGWFSLADGMARITVGRAGGSWANYGTEDWSSGDALGVRVNVYPIDGLDVGFVLRPTYRTTSLGPVTASNENRLTYALGNTHFGAKYAPDGGLFGVSANVQLRSQFESRGNPANPAFGGGLGMKSRGLKEDITSAENDIRLDQNKQTSTLGVNAWGGVDLSLIDDLTLEVGARFDNLDDFAWSGRAWLNQKVEYDLSPITVGINMNQVLLSGKLMRLEGNGNYGGRTNLILTFEPYVEYELNDTTAVGGSVFFAMAPGWKYGPNQGSQNAMEIEINPYVDKSMGSNLELSAGYIFGWGNGLGISGANSSSTHQIYTTFRWWF